MSSPKPLTIWCNTKFSDEAAKLLVDGVQRGGRDRRILWSASSSASVLDAGKPDPLLDQADIALGQPDVIQCMGLKSLKWIEVSTAGYTRYDREDFQNALRARDGVFTNVSQVFAVPCAQHALAMMLAFGRQLLPSYRDQLTDRSWHYLERRFDSRLLNGETVLMLGYGAIGRKLTEYLAPFQMKLMAVRRRVYSEQGVHIIPEEKLSSALATADHVVNILPENEATKNYVNARRLGWCKLGAKFYNVGRGTTVDQNALVEALESGRLGAAYLDVTDPEPLPPSHPLWTARNCHITPHTAGGRRDQDEAIVQHFLKNLEIYENGGDARVGMTDRIV